jgi:inorganic pyrophosphatase
LPVSEIVDIITEGAESFLAAEYYYCVLFIIGMCILLALTVERRIGEFWTTGAFFAGAVTSIVAGYIGMKVAVFANGRVAL